MEDNVRRSVVAVLRRSVCWGFAQVEARHGGATGLPRWKRLVNWLVAKLGAEQTPFVDPHNYTRVGVRPLYGVADPALIDAALRELADPPVCRVCGRSDALDVDPAGYYEHATRHDGAPLLCLHNEPDHERHRARGDHAP